jgi:polyribonucleotide nucleotidyltransferase
MIGDIKVIGGKEGTTKWQMDILLIDYKTHYT